MVDAEKFSSQNFEVKFELLHLNVDKNYQERRWCHWTTFLTVCMGHRRREASKNMAQNLLPFFSAWTQSKVHSFDPKNTPPIIYHILRACFGFLAIWNSSIPLSNTLFLFYWDPCFITSNNKIKKFISILMIKSEECQSRANTLFFVVSQ